jgi:hypothetical protein
MPGKGNKKETSDILELLLDWKGSGGWVVIHIDSLHISNKMISLSVLHVYCYK